MKRYLLELLALVLGLAVIVVAPGLAILVELVVLPVVLIGAWVAIVYLRAIYRRQRPPRSRFFGMLITVSARKEFIGLWIGYLVVARLGAELHLFALPVPPMPTSTAISGLVLIVFAAPPIAYGLAVWRVRRRAAYARLADQAIELDSE